MSLLPKNIYFNNFLDDFLEEKTNLMKCDIYEENNEYHIIMDIPGFNKEDIKVELNDEYITVEASKNEYEEDSNKNYLRKERTVGQIKRQFYVGNIEENNIKAYFKNGTLSMIIPKSIKKESKKQINID